MRHRTATYLLRASDVITRTRIDDPYFNRRTLIPTSRVFVFPTVIDVAFGSALGEPTPERIRRVWIGFPKPTLDRIYETSRIRSITHASRLAFDLKATPTRTVVQVRIEISHRRHSVCQEWKVCIRLTSRTLIHVSARVPVQVTENLLTKLLFPCVWGVKVRRASFHPFTFGVRGVDTHHPGCDADDNAANESSHHDDSCARDKCRRDV
mmetsp:Transcript_8683/g.29233  ORF Transcript_8683/g.29233 Transcript_8683/m.29233 type:complete len:209 (+) Transcript_8683:94-720(+)